MELTFDMHIKEGEKITSFDLAKSFYKICKGSYVSAESVAYMMLLEAQDEQERGGGNE